MSQATHILNATQAGEPAAAASLLPLVYDELRQLAVKRLAREAPGHTLQATALVHEAFLRLAGADGSQGFNGRGHFFAVAAEAMQRILIDHARHKNSIKCGGSRHRLDVEGIELIFEVPAVDVLSLDEALKRFAGQHPRKAQLVKLRFFAGLTNEEAAEALGISKSTADNDWAYARSWLRLALGDAALGDRTGP